MVSSADFIQAAQARRTFLTQERDALETEWQEYDKERKRLEGLLGQVGQELASYLLVEVTDEEVEALQKRLRYPGLLPIKRQFEERLARAQARRAELEKLHEAVHNEFHLAQTKDEIEAIREAYNKLQQDVGLWRSNAWFNELESRGYFEPGYKSGFWSAFRDWRAVSHLMAEVEIGRDKPFAAPDEVRADWISLKSQWDSISEAWNDLHRKQRELTSLGNEYKEVCGAPERLFQEMYVALGDAILKHLEACPQDTLVELSASDENFATFLKKQVGLRKQVQYLREVPTTRIAPVLQTLKSDLSKLDRKIAKASYKGIRVTPDELNKLRDLKADRWSKRRQGLQEVRGNISGFHKYQKGSFAEDYLWWDLMTRRAYGGDIYEVRVFHEQHPGWDYNHYQDPWERSSYSGYRHTPSSHHQHAMDTAADSLVAEQGAGDWQADAS